MAICPIICSFYYLVRALMHDLACEFACAEECAETISMNVLNIMIYHTCTLVSLTKLLIVIGSRIPIWQEISMQSCGFLITGIQYFELFHNNLDTRKRGPYMSRSWIAQALVASVAMFFTTFKAHEKGYRHFCLICVKVDFGTGRENLEWNKR